MTDDHDRIAALEEHVTRMLDMICELTKTGGKLAACGAELAERLQRTEADITAINVRLPREPT